MNASKFGLLYDGAREARLKEFRRQLEGLDRQLYWIDDEIRRLERERTQQYQRAMVELLSEKPKGTPLPAPLTAWRAE